MASQNATVLVSRLLSLKESSPFILVLDSLFQSSHHLINEFAFKSSSHKIIYLSYETLNRPAYAAAFIDCTSLQPKQVVSVSTKEIGELAGSSTSKTLVIIDSLNYIPSHEITAFVSSLISPSITVLGTFHTNSPQVNSTIVNYPSPITLLSYIASSIFEVEPLNQSHIDEETLDYKLNRLQFPIKSGLNESFFKIILTNRRKSGRSIIYKFKFNAYTHEFEIFKSSQEGDIDTEDESLLRDLTTFNLTTNSKQKLAREQVELPFMQAQEALGSSGGAIVYEFEKDDDYDEEDPYEDPF